MFGFKNMLLRAKSEITGNADKIMPQHTGVRIQDTAKGYAMGVSIRYKKNR